MIAIIDYGAGNIGSVKNALDYLGINNMITNNIEEIKKVDKIILPGQGRFGDVMNKLRERKLDKVLISEIQNGKPYFGICIGLQILFEKSEEDPNIKGLGIIKGTVKRFQTKLKIPQIGWNKIKQRKESLLFQDLIDDYYYFVHSYYVVPNQREVILATTNYDNEFVSAIQKNNIYATQFHPEKSAKIGLKLLKKFGEL